MKKELKTYEEIVNPVKEFSSELENCFAKHFNTSLQAGQSNQLLPIIKDFLYTKGKRLRSNLIFLLTKALGDDVTEAHYKLALTQEIIHNATLIHDDIIDCSELRRGHKTLNFEYDSKLAVLAGDFLLSEAMGLIDSFDNEDIRKLHSRSLKEMINGELNQYFNRYKLLSLAEYLEKSKAKTARLFECGLTGAYLLSSRKNEHLQNVKDFALNFGTAFQLKNDLENFLSPQYISEDLQNGDYSAPVIFYFEEKNIKSPSENDIKHIAEKISSDSAIRKTKELIEKFSDKAIENIAFIEDNLYKRSLTDLCGLLKRG